MTKFSKFYTEKLVEIGDEQIPIRAYKIGDGPEVAAMLEKQFEFEDLNIKTKGKKVDENKLRSERTRLIFEMEELAIGLAARGILRSIEPETRKMQVEELDVYIKEESEFELEELNPELANQIAWSMIGLGLPKSESKVDDTPEMKKNSQAKDSSKDLKEESN
jgi:hypothetical protein